MWQDVAGRDLRDVGGVDVTDELDALYVADAFAAADALQLELEGVEGVEGAETRSIGTQGSVGTKRVLAPKECWQ